MNELTKIDGKNVVICQESCPSVDPCIANHPCDIEQAIIDELSEYRDTGLTPEEVTRYKAFADKAVTEGVTMGEIKRFIGGENQKLPLTTGFSIRHLIDLGRAEKECRLLVLPEGMSKGTEEFIRSLVWEHQQIAEKKAESALKEHGGRE